MPDPEDRTTSARYVGLSTEDMTLVEEMVAPDQGSKVFGVTPARTKRFLEGMPLSSLAPEPVGAAAKRIGKLLMFGFLEYEFYTIASVACITLSELALNCAVGPAEPCRHVPNLQELLSSARMRGLLPSRITDRQLEALRGLRNDMAHPRGCDLLAPAIAFEMYVTTMDLVNSLFDAAWRSNEPEAVRLIRERYQDLVHAPQAQE
jgi:hypothetical protein